MKLIRIQVLEGGNEFLIAELYSLLTDAYVGLAGQANEGTKERELGISNALLYLERAKEGKLFHVVGVNDHCLAYLRNRLLIVHSSVCECRGLEWRIGNHCKEGHVICI